MFAMLCAATFILFVTYWASIITCKKTIKKFNNRNQKAKSLPIQLNQYMQPKATQKQNNFTSQNKSTDFATFQIKYVNVRQQKQDQYQKEKLDKQNNNNINEEYRQSERNLLKVAQKPHREDNSMASSVNELNIGMIQQTDVSRKYSGTKKEANQQNAQNSSNIILHEIKEHLICGEDSKQSTSQFGQMMHQVEPLTPIPFVNSNYNETQRDRKDERSQLQIIQALSNPKINERQDLYENDLVQAYQRKQSEADFVIAKLIQQIDQLFLNDQQKFITIIDKYKIRETRFASQQQNYRELNQKRLDELMQVLKERQEQQDRLEIQISQYKQQNEEKQSLIKKQKQIIQKLQSTIKQIKQNHRKENEQSKNDQNKIQSELRDNNQKLKTKVQIIEQKIVSLEQKLQLKQQKQVQFEQQQKKLKEQIYLLKQQINKKQLENKKICEKLTLQLDETKHQLASSEVKCNQLQKQQSEIDDQSEQVLPKFGTMQISPEQIQQIKLTNQNLKNELQFAQTQMRMFQQADIQHLQKIQKLEKELSGVSSSNFNEILDLRNKISRMQPIVNEFEVLQKRYFELKLKYDRAIYQKQKDKTMLRTSGVKQTPLEISGSNLKAPSPKLNRNINHNQGSPKQQIFNNNSSSDKKSVMMGHYRFLFDCNFVNLQDRQFLYETIHNFFKGILKTEKLYNSKTNKLKNPHQLIDNIRGILVLVELQNGKIIGAYTHQPFSIINPHSSADNIAFLLDVSNRKSFTNQSGINSVTYNPSSLVWGLNELMLKFEQPEVMYTNFCRNHNIYWDGKCKLQDFIGTDKQWARINQYQLFRVSKV